MRVFDHVVLGLGLVRIAGQPAPLPQRAELRIPAGEQLVHVGLVAGVEQDPVYRGVEHAMHGDRQLDDAEIRPEMPAVLGHDLDQGVPDLRS